MKGTKVNASTTKRADNKLAVNSKATKKTKAAKDPNKPKRPPSAFFIFMEDFRKQYKLKYPDNKSVAVVGKSGGEKWKSMSDEEKAPFVAKAEKRKADYALVLKAYNDKQAKGANADEDEGSDKSKSEVNDGNGESGEEEADD